MLNLGGGFLAMIGNPLSGRLSDRFGRRPVCILFLALGVAGGVALYISHSALVGALWVLLIFGINGTEVTLGAYAAELFPTSRRSTASGARTFAATLGVALGLSGVSLLHEPLGSTWLALAALASSGLPVLLLVRLGFPETAGRSLEEIAPEPALSASSRSG